MLNFFLWFCALIGHFLFLLEYPAFGFYVSQILTISTVLVCSETEEPSGGLSQIAARVLATSLPMYRKLLFTKLSPSLDTTQFRAYRLLIKQSPQVTLMFGLVVDGNLRFT